MEATSQSIKMELGGVEFLAYVFQLIDHRLTAFFAVNGEVVIPEEMVGNVVSLFQSYIDYGENIFTDFVDFLMVRSKVPKVLELTSSKNCLNHSVISGVMLPVSTNSMTQAKAAFPAAVSMTCTFSAVTPKMK
jgi:hypothetical protein